MNLDLQKVLPAEAFETEQNEGDYMVDASSSAFTELESGATYSAPPKDSQLGKSSYWNK